MNSIIREAEERYRQFVFEVYRISTVWALANGDQLAVWADEEGCFITVELAHFEP